MSAVTASAVKELRERSGAGMMDAKKALEETNGDMEAAVDLLRAKGLATAAKKSSRTAAEGLVGVAVDGTKGTAVEVNSQTDFVARTNSSRISSARLLRLLWALVPMTPKPSSPQPIPRVAAFRKF